MRVETQAVDAGELDVDVLGVPVAATTDYSELQLPEAVRTRLAALADAGDVRSDVGATAIVHLNGELAARRLAAVGVGAEPDADAIRTAAAAVARAATSFGGAVGWLVDPSLPVPVTDQARAAVEGIAYGAYVPARWKTGDPKTREIDRVVLAGSDESDLAAPAERAATIARWVDFARDLANAPPNELTPEELAARAAAAAEDAADLHVEALDRAQIESLGMGAFAAVAQGSAHEPRLIVMRYGPSDAGADVTLGLVGKAVTFDTGGISLKPALSMDSMKGDMAGGAAVIAATLAMAELGLPVNVVTVVAATENMPGGNAFRPGDILRARNGKTIEITNTDAEGRLVLADALTYAREHGATHVVDVATLTGAMELALGDLYAGLFANEDDWRDALLAAAATSGDHLWPFPLHPRYRRYVDSDFADLKNSSPLKQASPALAAEFLREFAGDGPWAHIDMAGPGYLERSRGDYLTQRGGTGWGVRLLVELAGRLA
jgi:leucyl aminopeptidase